MNRVALITGGTRGIGLGVALALARDGFSLGISGRRPEHEVIDALDELRSHGADVLYLRSDVSVPGDRARMLAEIEARFARLDVLINNAGIAPRVRADMLDADEAGFDELFSVNLKGPYFLTQAVAKWMIRQHAADPGLRCSIVHIGSVSATVASTNRGDYCISKAGIAMASRLWAVRLAEHAIDVYEVRPGIIDTDMTGGVREKYDRLIAGDLLLQKRWGTPDDVGIAVRALVRGDIPYATGSVLVLDGGLTIPRL